MTREQKVALKRHIEEESLQVFREVQALDGNSHAKIMAKAKLEESVMWAKQHIEAMK